MFYVAVTVKIAILQGWNFSFCTITVRPKPKKDILSSVTMNPVVSSSSKHVTIKCNIANYYNYKMVSFTTETTSVANGFY